MKQVAQDGEGVGSQIHQGQLLAVMDALRYELTREYIERKVKSSELCQAGDGGEGRETVHAEVKQLQLGQVVEGDGDVSEAVALEHQ